MTRIGHNSKDWAGAIAILTTMLASTNEDEVVSYRDMAVALNAPITAQHYALRKALNRLEKQAIHFECIANAGYRRMHASAVAQTGTKRSLLKVYRASRRGLSRATLGESYRDLKPHERGEYHAKLAVLQAVKQSTHGNTIKAEVRRKTSALDAEMAALCVATTKAP
jgi:hypothetical protein